MKSRSLLFSTIVMLLLANIYQILNNQTLHQQITRSEKLVDSTMRSNSLSFELREEFFQALALQNHKVDCNSTVTDIYGNKRDLSVIISDSSKLVLYFNEIGCTSCNINKIDLVLENLKKSGISDYLVLTNYENFNEFTYVINATNLNKQNCYNANIELKTGNYKFDKLLLFVLDDSCCIKYPFIVNVENLSEIITYFHTLEVIKII
ncbi:MAG: hypothetical protein H6541_11115 [Lentimicrobiaceae bacterium]|nr:hypothetical protein [Lentimicrobiaceae bacterium]